MKIVENPLLVYLADVFVCGDGCNSVLSSSDGTIDDVGVILYEISGCVEGLLDATAVPNVMTTKSSTDDSVLFPSVEFLIELANESKVLGTGKVLEALVRSFGVWIAEE